MIISGTYSEKFDPEKHFDFSQVKLENAIPCEGCQKGMALMKDGGFQCPHCGAQSTRFGGFWRWEDLRLSIY